MIDITQHQNSHNRLYIGRYLRQRRIGLKLSQNDVAAQLQFPSSRYRSLESGRAKMDAQTFSQLCGILGLDQKELIEIINISKIANANSLFEEFTGDYPK